MDNAISAVLIALATMMFNSIKSTVLDLFLPLRLLYAVQQCTAHMLGPAVSPRFVLGKQEVIAWRGQKSQAALQARFLHVPSG